MVNQSVAINMALLEDSKDTNFLKTSLSLFLLFFISFSLSIFLVSSLPDGSPTNVVPPPSNKTVCTKF